MSSQRCIAFAASSLALTARAIDVTWNFDGATPLSASMRRGHDHLSRRSGDRLGARDDDIWIERLLRPAGLPRRRQRRRDELSRDLARVKAISVNHGGAATDAYTMIWDYLSPAASDGKWRALYQSDLTNSNDGEFFIQNSPSGGIGISGFYQGSIAPNAWNRIAVTREANGTMSKFINGALVGTQSSTDARFVLDPSFYLFTDEDNETAPGYVSSFRYVDSALTGEQVRLLGNVYSAGATVAGPDDSRSAAARTARPDAAALRPHPNHGPPRRRHARARKHPRRRRQRLRSRHRPDRDRPPPHLRRPRGRLPRRHARPHHQRHGPDRQPDARPGEGARRRQLVQPPIRRRKGADAHRVAAIRRRPRPRAARREGAGRTKHSATPSTPRSSPPASSLDDIWVWPSSSQYTNDPRFGNAEIQLLSSIPGNLSDANLQALKASGVDGLSVGDGSITQEAINAFHRNGMWVDVYTVNSPARMEQLIAMGVDSIETDRPDLMADIIFAGDADNDFDVDGADFLSWQRQGNFATNLAAWKKTFGHAPGSLPAGAVPFASAVPEPTQPSAPAEPSLIAAAFVLSPRSSF